MVRRANDARRIARRRAGDLELCRAWAAATAADEDEDARLLRQELDRRGYTDEGIQRILDQPGRAADASAGRIRWRRPARGSSPHANGSPPCRPTAAHPGCRCALAASRDRPFHIFEEQVGCALAQPSGTGALIDVIAALDGLDRARIDAAKDEAA